MNDAEIAYVSTADLEAALRRAEAAQRQHEQSNGHLHLFRRSNQDENWPARYAAYMVAEQAGTDLPAYRNSSTAPVGAAATAGATRHQGTGE